MREDLFVLLEPRVHRIPFEPDSVTQLLERPGFVTHGGGGSLFPAGSDGERAAVTSARRVGEAAVGLEQLQADVGESKVVRRVVGLFPHEQGGCRVDNELPAEIRAY